ncbi:MAG: hypothetical protein ACLFNQ_13945 [Spirochaetaceae bacterium]
MFRTILQWTWELPQTLLGLVVFLTVRLLDRGATTRRYRKSTVLTRTTVINGGVSLGMFLFSFDYARGCGISRPDAQRRMDNHEWGHSVQSRYLGPAYLIVIGVPSVTRAIRSRFRRRRCRSRKELYDDRWYYRGFPEAWADRLGGVRR